jgi:alpha-1,3-glucosyltransferase
LAITYSQPICLWYFEATSEWTLDYPPFFAYYQFILANFGVLMDRDIIKVFIYFPLFIGNLFYSFQIDSLNFASENTVLFMRLSVIVTDLPLIIVTWLYFSKNVSTFRRKIFFFVIVSLNAGLLLVDHIHFQYNGLLIGLLVACVYFADSHQYLLLALCFSSLVLMKHLFLPLAPIFAVYLLRNYCAIQKHCEVNNANESRKHVSCFSLLRFTQLALIAVVTLSIGFGPFMLCENYIAQLQQMFARLFPFGRGLVHAYWAPNVWALYCALDKIGYYFVTKIMRLPSTPSDNMRLNDSASGVVGDFALFLLPRITATHCIVLLSICLVPAMWILCRHGVQCSTKILLRSLLFVSLSSFMLGYHVHEKAVLVPLVLQTLVVFSDETQILPFMLMASAGIFGLFPLFRGPAELMIKSNVFILHVWLKFIFLQALGAWRTYSHVQSF